MLKKNVGPDIAETLGKVDSTNQMDGIFRQYMDDIQYDRLKTIKNETVLKRIANAITVGRPRSVFINTGSQEDRQFIRDLALKNKEEAPLAMPDHTIHYDLAEEQARIVDRTFYITDPNETVSTLANRMERDQALEEIGTHMTGIMENKTMIVGFYMRGPVGAPAANPALEITSSAYVSHSAEILYRNAFHGFDREVKTLGHFFTNIHSEGQNRNEDLPNARVFMDRSYRTTYSFNCTYAGNTLLLKKGNHRFAVDKAVYENRGKELSEHMFITGIKGPGGRVSWCAGAAPSGCGKTTTAMAGDCFVGDDLAQMWIAKDGSVRSINPECGIFGILQDVNWEGDPQLMENLRKSGTEVIWTNVLVDEDKKPHWVGNGEPSPEKGFNFQGEWHKGMTDAHGKPVPISHANSRCTLASTALDNYSQESENPDGVETRMITYSGRDSDTMPPVWVAKNEEHGVVLGACIVSASTATELGVSGVRRSPWANAAFIPGALGDYMDAQFKFFGNPAIATEKKPIMAGLNYFLTEGARGGDSKKLLGEKRDVKVWLSWLERYAHREVKRIETPIGHLPLYEDLKVLFMEILGKEYPHELYIKQFSLYVDNIIERLEFQIEAYSKEKSIPDTLFKVLHGQKEELMVLRQEKGAIVAPGEMAGH